VTDFKAKLKREGMAGESFVLQKNPIQAPRNRRVETAKGRYAPPVHMIKLTETRQVTPYKWVHPDEEEGR
jgi:hypothetical protein